MGEKTQEMLRDLAGQFYAAASKNEVERKAGLPETGFIARTRGRPKGSTKAGGRTARLAMRLTAEQAEKLARLPGLTVSEKIRRLLDASPA